MPACTGVCQQLWTTADDDGSYSIELPDGFYIALCGTDDHRTCTPPGANGPYTIEVPPYDQSIDFLVKG